MEKRKRLQSRKMRKKEKDVARPDGVRKGTLGEMALDLTPGQPGNKKLSIV